MKVEEVVSELEKLRIIWSDEDHQGYCKTYHRPSIKVHPLPIWVMGQEEMCGGTQDGHIIVIASGSFDEGESWANGQLPCFHFKHKGWRLRKQLLSLGSLKDQMTNAGVSTDLVDEVKELCIGSSTRLFYIIAPTTSTRSTRATAIQKASGTPP